VGQELNILIRRDKMQINIYDLIEANKIKEVEKILKKSVDINRKNEFALTPLHIALANNHENMAKFLLNNGANGSIQDDDGFTSLHYAYEYSMPNIAKIIIEKNSEALNVKDKYGNNPLWTATMNAEIPLADIEFLLKKGADKNSKNKANMSPYDLAKSYGVEELTKLFEKY
jgi:ankyrin repeat protein